MATDEKNPAFENWGFHINHTGYSRSFPSIPDWLNPIQKEDWSKRGLIIWDSGIKCVTHLYASYALIILKNMKAADAWKIDGVIVGTPVYEITFEAKRGRRKNKSADTPEEKPDGKWALANQISLLPLAAQDLYNFLASHEDELKQIASADAEDRRTRLSKVYELILNLSRSGKEYKTSPVIRKKAQPISIPAGQYLTLAQIAEFCNETTRSVKRWIEKEGLAALEISRGEKLIQVSDLNAFLEKAGKPPVEIQE